MLNEENSIGKVLDDLPTVEQVIVVDNGSTDQGPEIAKSRGATVIEEPQRGYGKACLTGIDYAANQIQDPANAVIAFLDADYSDHPEEVTNLLEQIQQGHDFVIGSRSIGEREAGAMPIQAVLGNRLACSLMWLFWGKKFTDLGPFRAIRFDALQRLGMQDENFGWTIEMQIKAVQHDLKLCEIPVSYRCRIGTSKISGTISGTLRAGYKILYTIFRYRLFGNRLR